MDFQFIADFFSTPSMWYNLLAISLTTLGLLYGIIKDYIQSKKKEPVYWIRTTHLIRETLKDLKGISIRYNNVEVTDLSSTKFVFWNKGKDAIKRGDIASRNPIKISIDPDYVILDAFIEKKTDEDNNFTLTLSPDGKSILVDFEFMEKNDGISLKLTHTAPASKNFKITGKVISGSKIVYMPSPSYSDLFQLWGGEKRINSSTIHNFFKFITFLGGLLLLLVQMALIKENNSLSYIVRFVLLLLGLFYIYAALFIVRRRIPRKLDEE